MVTFPVDYKKYIQSEEWKKKSRAWIKETGRCEMCNWRKTLCCHHKHYKTLGREKREDINVLCFICHQKISRKSRRMQETEGKDWFWKEHIVPTLRPILKNI